MKAAQETRRIVATLALAILASCSGLETEIPAERTNAPYVPTPYETVWKMLDLAGAGPGDVLYDLGSGDGRIPIVAVKRYGVKRATGIEIDPELVRRSKANARKAGVADRVRFMAADIFETDFSDATVVTLYLLQALNLELQPRLLNGLKPGTRIVSHRFDLGGWEPDGFARAGESDDETIDGLYLWIVPAAVGGQWRLAAGGESYALRLRQIFQEVDGAITVQDTNAAIREGHLAGDRLRFRAETRRDGRTVAIAFDGRVTGQSMTGTFTIDGRAMPASATFIGR